MWLLQKEVSLEKVPEQIEEVHIFITKEREESRIAGEIISRLVREGVVREDELLRLIRRKEIILAFPYAVCSCMLFSILPSSEASLLVQPSL